jgi:hypothetical protein
MDWINVAQDKDQWRSVVKTVIEFLEVLVELRGWWLLMKGSAL